MKLREYRTSDCDRFYDLIKNKDCAAILMSC